MITLATLKEASLQQIFDQVVTHLLTQNKQARAKGDCQYRTDSGLKCAVGCLISDDEYDPKMDDSFFTVEDITGLDYESKKCQLLCDLQTIHDKLWSTQWPSALKQLAEEFNLQYNHDNTSNA